MKTAIRLYMSTKEGERLYLINQSKSISSRQFIIADCSPESSPLGEPDDLLLTLNRLLPLPFVPLR